VENAQAQAAGIVPEQLAKRVLVLLGLEDVHAVDAAIEDVVDAGGEAVSRFSGHLGSPSLLTGCNADAKL
jgi:hypothetical protein